NNAVTLNNSLTFGGSNNLSFGSASVVTEAASRSVTLLGSSSNALTFGIWNVSASGLTVTVNAPQGSGASLNIGSLDLFSTSGTAGTTTIAGTGVMNISDHIQSTVTAQALTISGQGITVNLGSNANTYTGLTTVTLGTLKLTAANTFNSAGALTLGAAGAV